MCLAVSILGIRYWMTERLNAGIITWCLSGGVLDGGVDTRGLRHVLGTCTFCLHEVATAQHCMYLCGSFNLTHDQIAMDECYRVTGNWGSAPRSRDCTGLLPFQDVPQVRSEAGPQSSCHRTLQAKPPPHVYLCRSHFSFETFAMLS